MRRQHFIRGMSALLGAVVFGPALTACGGGGEEPAAGALPLDDVASTDPAAPGLPVASSAGLDAAEIAGLRFMREEEKLAHDVYVALFARWGRNVFSSIADSETQHTEAVLGQLQRYGIDDPAAGKAAGEFEDSYLQALYDRLVAMGNVSQEEALKVGCLIEETDIQDIRDKMAETDETSIRRVYQSLLCGSYNHLKAFNGQLGTPYAAQVIPQALYDEIAAGSATCTG